ncbi:MAG: hypothetical protein WCC06_10715 [Candidatus Aminicenantales bacterium]
MKKAIVLVIIIVALIFLTGLVFSAESKNDFQTIKKAVKDNPNYESGKEVKWFKILVTDSRTDKVKVRVTVPISLVELLACSTKSSHFGMRDNNLDIDLREILAELKKIGPMAFIEVYEDDETVKVWIE